VFFWTRYEGCSACNALCVTKLKWGGITPLDVAHFYRWGIIITLQPVPRAHLCNWPTLARVSVFCGLDFRLLQSRPFTNSQFHFLLSVQCNELVSNCDSSRIRSQFLHSCVRPTATIVTVDLLSAIFYLHHLLTRCTLITSSPCSCISRRWISGVEKCSDFGNQITLLTLCCICNVSVSLRICVACLNCQFCCGALLHLLFRYRFAVGCRRLCLFFVGLVVADSLSRGPCMYKEATEISTDINTAIQPRVSGSVVQS